ncbi:pantothenate synthetase [Catellatospora methionotrophica]|uniref:Pantothenate synthetase n=1 Tax=Catellatospora methionotrophica TaxID=121620 RepID=A0A8J3L9U6_9ACTN|nr:pantoate--beta-alanine ligase [Catellatospora methionotrophica]GIG14384.1 pantothenate synthetase [Catellatospora methionotrophica]
MTAVVRTREELAQARAAAQGSVAVVMTMGALHEGHATLLREARKHADVVLATIFVNPLQFGPNEDLARYPRTFDADVAVCAAEGVDVIFAPTPEVMYPYGQPQVTVHPGPLGEVLEGAVRPGHFAGVLTVVGKLLLLTRPDLAFFGEKDYQQLTLIKAMVHDLELGVEIVGVPTVREADGLALSSRNRYLSEAERRAALALSRALRAGAAERDPGAVLAAARAELTGLDVDYLALRGADLSEDPAGGEARLLVAARLGTTRLIDNLPVHLDGTTEKETA